MRALISDKMSFKNCGPFLTCRADPPPRTQAGGLWISLQSAGKPFGSAFRRPHFGGGGIKSFLHRSENKLLFLEKRKPTSAFFSRDLMVFRGVRLGVVDDL